MSPSLLIAALTLANSWGINVVWDAELRRDAADTGLTTALLETAGQAHDHIAAALALPGPTVTVHVHTADTYARMFGPQFSASWWAHYQQGAVHVNGGVPLGGRFVGLVYHEMTHAVVDVAGKRQRLPRWLNEGLAEYFAHAATGRSGVDDVQRIFLKDAARARQLVALPAMPSTLDATQYLECYAAVTLLSKDHGEAKVFELVRRMLTGESADEVFSWIGEHSVTAFSDKLLRWTAAFEG